MTGFLTGLVIILAGGILSGLLSRNTKSSAMLGAGSLIVGAAVMLAAVLTVMICGVAMGAHCVWQLPMASFMSLELDALSAFFAGVILLVSVLSALYGWGYFRPAKTVTSRSGAFWLYFNLLVFSMLVVVTARNMVLFLLAWEVMSVSSFFLVAYEREHMSARHAAWVYMVAMHFGAVPLLVMFLLISGHVGSFDFSAWNALSAAPPVLRNTVFMLGLVGFGVKAGIYPLHIWLPEAHPAAPSHVSALMSGVMIKTGIYAYLRLWCWLGLPSAWWGWLVLALGVVSGLMGVALALAQHDIKRLLAYHSVENIGIITMGLGLGLLGWTYNQPVVMIAGFTGGLLHVLNHAVFKALLFFSAGAVVHATHCRDLDRMGGLFRCMPYTGAAFGVGSAAISGLPPLNGFVSEFLIYIAAFTALSHVAPGLAVAGVAVVCALALIGGLASACFAKVFGVVFLGSAREPLPAPAHECPWPMCIPQLILAFACFVIVWVAPWLVSPLLCVAVGFGRHSLADCRECMTFVTAALPWLSASSIGMVMICVVLAFVRRRVLRGRSMQTAGIWDCGFVAPTPRMQYTASSFVQPITTMFRWALNLRIHADLPSVFFPKRSQFFSHTTDAVVERVFRPVFHIANHLMIRLRWLQEGRVQIYLLYIAVTLTALILFAL